MLRRMDFTVRAGRPSDGLALRGIERSAGERFRDVGLPDVADAEPASVEELARRAAEGRSWVAVDGDGCPVGYVLVEVVDGNAHIEQVSVDPAHQGRGVGRTLIEQVRTWAVDGDLPAITLTTFRDVPWNAPLYEHLGFRVLDEEEIGPELRAIRDDEAAQGLDPAQRFCMLRDVRAQSEEDR
jgi:GNAT superfamily N-acetyltransferase